jgi:cell division protein FtsN
MAYMEQRPLIARALLVFVGGLVVGLAIAAGLALYLTKAPIPFVNKVQRATENVNPAASGKLPDPNAPLYKSAPATTTTPPQIAPPPAPPAAVADAIPATPGAPATAPIEEGTRFMLQAGAFRNADEADAMRARLALVGLEAKVFPGDQAGETLYRVRLGPYGSLDDVNRIRARLIENGMESQLVRIR